MYTTSDTICWNRLVPSVSSKKIIPTEAPDWFFENFDQWKSAFWTFRTHSAASHTMWKAVLRYCARKGFWKLCKLLVWGLSAFGKIWSVRSLGTWKYVSEPTLMIISNGDDVPVDDAGEEDIPARSLTPGQKPQIWSAILSQSVHAVRNATEEGISVSQIRVQVKACSQTKSQLLFWFKCN